MSTINITNARQNLFQLVSDVNIRFNPITIVNNKGENAILISEDEWKNIEGTLYLSSIPGLVDDVNKIRKNSKTILNLMMEDPFCYPPSYEKLTGDLNGLYS